MSDNKEQSNEAPEQTVVGEKRLETERDADIRWLVAKLKHLEENGAGEKEKKHSWTWDQTMEVVKVVATVWVALLGSYVTVQFNERQHELNRIEAISTMLSHVSQTKDKNGMPIRSIEHDAAIWAIFRIANNGKMLRDLAALFPEDIYRVVSSIAASGELRNDHDAIDALTVASEKLATEYSADPHKADLSSRLFAQALQLRSRADSDQSPLH